MSSMQRDELDATKEVEPDFWLTSVALLQQGSAFVLQRRFF
jgi:hypothetical protein